jgi:hypothetical protein
VIDRMTTKKHAKAAWAYVLPAMEPANRRPDDHYRGRLRAARQDAAMAAMEPAGDWPGDGPLKLQWSQPAAGTAG